MDYTFSNPREVLGIGPSDDPKAAYRRLALTKHPDVGGDPDEWLRIEMAYRQLARGERPRMVRQHDGRMLDTYRMTEGQIAGEIAAAKREIELCRKGLETVKANTASWCTNDYRIPQMRKVFEDRIERAGKVIEQLS